MSVASLDSVSTVDSLTTHIFEDHCRFLRSCEYVISQHTLALQTMLSILFHRMSVHYHNIEPMLCVAITQGEIVVRYISIKGYGDGFRYLHMIYVIQQLFRRRRHNNIFQQPV